MNNWEKFNQSTPKLLPPAAFEKTNNEIIHKNNSINQNTNSALTENSSNESYLIALGGESQSIQLSKDLEKLKLENYRVNSENEILKTKNKGNSVSNQIFIQLSLL
jgi:hypothetical protein